MYLWFIHLAQRDRDVSSIPSIIMVSVDEVWTEIATRFSHSTSS